jgi:hypothetical protein
MTVASESRVLIGAANDGYNGQLDVDLCDEALPDVTQRRGMGS